MRVFNLFCDKLLLKTFDIRFIYGFYCSFKNTTVLKICSKVYYTLHSIHRIVVRRTLPSLFHLKLETIRNIIKGRFHFHQW